jgi:hypothetical protein
MGFMVNTGLTIAPSTSGVRCRPIADGDAQAIVALLARGFAPRRTPQFWQDVIACLARRAVPADAPRYGYLLESNRAPVGALLQIFSKTPVRDDDGSGTPELRCSVSSWYVEPEFRSYAPLLVRQALKRRDVTYLNTSPAPHTRPIAVAQGYAQYSNGTFVAIPLLGRAPNGACRIVATPSQPRAPFEPHEHALLEEHAAFGCMSMWCETAERAYPFVFRPRWIMRFVRCAQLVYCRDVAEFIRFARPLGVHLAARGWPLVMVDANAPIDGLVGRYFDGIMPKYFKGPAAPRLGDLAYTEAALFGM